MDKSTVMHIWSMSRKWIIPLVLMSLSQPCVAIRNAQVGDFDLDGLCSNIPTPHTDTTLAIFQSFIGNLKNAIANIGKISAYRQPTNLTSIPKYWYALPSSTDPIRVASTATLSGFTPGEWMALKAVAFSYQFGETQGSEPVKATHYKMTTTTQQAYIISSIDQWLSTLTFDKIESSPLITLFQAGYICALRIYDPLATDLDYASMMDFWVLFHSAS
jgi:hypothetical protein